MTISSVAAAVLPGAAETAAGDPTATGLGGLFAGLLGSGAASSDALPDGGAPSSDVTSPGAAAELLSAAQVMAAAQVVPVTPVLAAALTLQGHLGAAPGAGPSTAPVTSAPSTPTPVPGPVPDPVPTPAPTTLSTGSTAVSAGDPVLPAVPSSAVPLAAPAVTAQPGTPQGASEQLTAATNASAATTDPAAELTQGTMPDTGSDTDAGHQHGTAVITAASAPGRTGAPAQSSAQPAQVTGQVFPEIGRLVSRGDGTQRITLKLSPEALGEVRVVLTVRDGDVHVRMAGSELAQQALRAGAPELQRLLDLAGASSSHVVVGDQGASLETGLTDGSGADRSARHDPQQGTQDHRTAGRRNGDTSARDGTDGGPHKRSSTDPTADPGGPTRIQPGVDVTM